MLNFEQNKSADGPQIDKWLNEAAGHAERALALNPQDPDANELRGTARYFRWMYNLKSYAPADKLLKDAEDDLRAATANPLQASAWNGLSHLLNNKMQISEAKMAAQKAYDSDPYLKDVDKTIWRLFINSVELNARAEAEKWCTVGRQRMPDNFRFTECKLWLFSLQGQKPSVDSIWAAYKEFLDRSPPNFKKINELKGGMMVALGLVRAGLPDSARHMADRSRGNPQVDAAFELVKMEAQVRAQLGDKDDAIHLLSKFYAANPGNRAFAKFDESWWWDNIRDDPRYKALVGATP